jgi:hypothetical protein
MVVFLLCFLGRRPNGWQIRPELALNLDPANGQNNGSAMTQLGYESDRLRN